MFAEIQLMDDITYQSASSVSMVQSNIQTPCRWEVMESVQTKTHIHCLEVESIFPTMFRNMIDGSQNAVWPLAIEG